ncbi:hypothetical protein ACFL67_00665 [candidate division KSB1 bacterium]
MKRFTVILTLVTILTLGFSLNTFAQEPFSLGFHFTPIFPTGDFKSNSAEGGFGMDFDISIKVMENLSFIGSAGYHKFSQKRVDIFDVVDPTLLLSTEIISSVFLPFQGGLKYDFPLEGFTPYVMAKAGYFMGHESIDENNVGASPGFGVVVPIQNSPFMFNLGMQYNFIFSDPKAEYLGFNFGLEYGF